MDTNGVVLIGDYEKNLLIKDFFSKYKKHSINLCISELIELIDFMEDNTRKTKKITITNKIWDQYGGDILSFAEVQYARPL